jgi:hypothetical protein
LNRIPNAIRLAVQAVQDRLAGLSKDPGTLGIFEFPHGEEQTIYLANEEMVEEVQRLTFRSHGFLQTLPLTPVARRLADAIAKANGVGLAAVTNTVLAEVKRQKTTTSLDARVAGPTTVSRLRTQSEITGMVLEKEGLSIFCHGSGLRISLTPALWHMLAEKAMTIVDEMEGTKLLARPYGASKMLWPTEAHSGET